MPQFTRRSRADIGDWTANSLMSAPATNDLSPAPVMMMTRTDSSCLRSSMARRRSSSVAALSALRTFGRLIVTIATVDVVISSSTSGYSMSEMQTKCAHPERTAPALDALKGQS